MLSFSLASFLSFEGFTESEGSITIGGIILPVNRLAITKEPALEAVKLGTEPAEKAVAIINEINNHPDGYTVTLISANARAAGGSQARLNPAGGESSEFIPYSIKYGEPNEEKAVALTEFGTAVVTSATGRTAETGWTKSLKVEIPAAAGMEAGTYSDTITLTISAR